MIQLQTHSDRTHVRIIDIRNWHWNWRICHEFSIAQPSRMNNWFGYCYLKQLEIHSGQFFRNDKPDYSCILMKSLTNHTQWNMHNDAELFSHQFHEVILRIFRFYIKFGSYAKCSKYRVLTAKSKFTIEMQISRFERRIHVGFCRGDTMKQSRWSFVFLCKTENVSKVVIRCRMKSNKYKLHV